MKSTQDHDMENYGKIGDCFLFTTF